MQAKAQTAAPAQAEFTHTLAAVTQWAANGDIGDNAQDDVLRAEVMRALVTGPAYQAKPATVPPYPGEMGVWLLDFAGRLIAAAMADLAAAGAAKAVLAGAEGALTATATAREEADFWFTENV